MNALIRRLPVILLVAALSAMPAAAQQALDRSKIPPPGKAPELHVPAWTKTTLSNGVVLFVSEKHDLPLVSFSLILAGGADQFETAARRGVAGVTASMLSEGTTTRDGEAISNALQLLGTSVNVAVRSESGAMGFVSTTAKFAPTLDIMADMLLRSTFPAPALERIRAQRLVGLNSAKAQPGAIAQRVFPKVVYGTAHPFGQLVTEDTLKAVTRDDVVAFHKNYFQPGRASIVVVGDVTTVSAQAIVEKALSAWPAGGSKPDFSYPAVQPQKPTTIYLVDKPGAAQSTFAIGLPGPPRSTPDYYAIEVMNTLLGGMFQSRLNANIREEKGLSYGVNSGFAFGKGPGPFRAGGDIMSDKSDVALTEFMKEFRGIEGARPVTDDELQMSKNALVQSLPGMFDSVSSIGNAIGSLWQQGLPDDYYQQYGKHVTAITKDDVVGVAKKYIDLDHLSIIIVGDRKTIEAPLKATNIAPIVVLDIEGNTVK
jgi:zinc protease